MRPFFIRLAIVVASACTVSSALAISQQPFRKQPFTDVPDTHANYDAIEYLRKANVLKGYLDGTFQPAKRMTRSEFVSLLTNPFFISGRSNDCLKTNFPERADSRVFFRDVPRTSWYAQDVCEAIIHGIVNGYSDGTFRPQKVITFAEAAKIVANVMSIDVRRDGDGTDERWYVVYAQRLSELRAIPKTITRFIQPITRGEMAEMVYRLKVADTTKPSANFENIR
jgi:hypothetical protein